MKKQEFIILKIKPVIGIQTYTESLPIYVSYLEAYR